YIGIGHRPIEQVEAGWQELVIVRGILLGDARMLCQQLLQDVIGDIEEQQSRSPTGGVGPGEPRGHRWIARRPKTPRRLYVGPQEQPQGRVAGCGLRSPRRYRGRDGRRSSTALGVLP